MREREELKEEAEGWRRVAEILNTTATEAFEAYEEQLEVLRAEVRRTADKVSRQRGALNGLTRLHDENRSEEHTSELQSLMRISYAVFCLKKKTHKSTNITYPTHQTDTTSTTNRNSRK